MKIGAIVIALLISIGSFSSVYGEEWSAVQS